MKTREEIEQQVKLLEIATSEPDNYSSGIEFGEACGFLDALNWVLNNE